MEVVRIDPFDDQAFDRWFEVFHATDLERWPDGTGWQHEERRAMARDADGAEEHHCYLAVDDGVAMGVGDLELFRRENLHLARAEVRVPAAQQRMGVGSALLARMDAEARSAGRTEFGGMDDTPLSANQEAASGFARHHGFAPAQLMARRRLTLPLSSEAMQALRSSAQAAPLGYTLSTFVDRWPNEWLEDRCELGRRMSTDIPKGEQELDEELWDGTRVRRLEASLAAQNRTKVTTVAHHDGSGRIVAFSEVVIPRGAPEASWQHDTLVMREFRGHGLGFAVKLRNLEELQVRFPEVTSVSTWNAVENEHMIAINEAMGFELVSTSTYWLKKLE